MEHQFKPTNVWLASIVEAAGYRVDYPPNTKWMEAAVEGASDKRFVRFGLHEDWVVVYTHIADLPNAGPGRTDLLTLALRLNDLTGMGKYVLNDDWIALEAHHPAPHLTADNIARIFAGLQYTANHHEPQFHEAERASATLEALEDTFKRS